MSILIAYLIIGFIFLIGLLIEDHEDGIGRIKLLIAGVFLVVCWPACVADIIWIADKRRTQPHANH